MVTLMMTLRGRFEPELPSTELRQGVFVVIFGASVTLGEEDRGAGVLGATTLSRAGEWFDNHRRGFSRGFFARAFSVFPFPPFGGTRAGGGRSPVLASVRCLWGLPDGSGGTRGRSPLPPPARPSGSPIRPLPKGPSRSAGGKELWLHFPFSFWVLPNGPPSPTPSPSRLRRQGEGAFRLGSRPSPGGRYVRLRGGGPGRPGRRSSRRWPPRSRGGGR